MITIRGREIDVDIWEEICNYEWLRGKRKGDEFVCCSPFRDEKHPSFSINLETGLWIDFGSPDDQWKKGTFPRLLSFLENISLEEAEEALLAAYGLHIEDAEDKPLTIRLVDPEPPKTFTRDELKPYLVRYKPYLHKRGISDQVQQQFIVGFDKDSKAVVFFWRDEWTGKVVAVKFRSIRDKNFYYLNGGQRINDHLYGMYDVIQRGIKTIYLVESEIDCLYLWSHGLPAVAIGGSYLSYAQKKLLIRAGIEKIIIAVDNDKAGNRLRGSLKHELGGLVQLKDLQLPPGKDVNDMTPDQLQQLDRSEVYFRFLEMNEYKEKKRAASE